MDDLIMAALGGDENRVGQLLAAGANVNHGNGWTALIGAAARGHANGRGTRGGQARLESIGRLQDLDVSAMAWLVQADATPAAHA